MDKSLKRSIGYIKSNSIKLDIPKGQKVKVDKKEPIKSIVENNISIITWLLEKDLINRSALCKSVGLNRANFDKYIKMGKFPEKTELLIINKIKEYGYTTL